MPQETDAILVFPGAFFLENLVEFEKAAVENKLPLVSGPAGPQAQVLITYGPDNVAMGQQASRLASKIFQGTDPASLPVETADFFLGINLETANALGLDISDDILQQADTIIR